MSSGAALALACSRFLFSTLLLGLEKLRNPALVLFGIVELKGCGRFNGFDELLNCFLSPGVCGSLITESSGVIFPKCTSSNSLAGRFSKDTLLLLADFSFRLKRPVERRSNEGEDDLNVVCGCISTFRRSLRSCVRTCAGEDAKNGSIG